MSVKVKWNQVVQRSNRILKILIPFGTAQKSIETNKQVCEFNDNHFERTRNHHKKKWQWTETVVVDGEMNANDDVDYDYDCDYDYHYYYYELMLRIWRGRFAYFRSPTFIQKSLVWQMATDMSIKWPDKSKQCSDHIQLIRKKRRWRTKSSVPVSLDRRRKRRRRKVKESATDPIRQGFRTPVDSTLLKVVGRATQVITERTTNFIALPKLCNENSDDESESRSRLKSVQSSTTMTLNSNDSSLIRVVVVAVGRTINIGLSICSTFAFVWICKWTIKILFNLVGF